MDEDNRQIRWLLAASAVLGALIIGYNVLFVPQVTLTTLVHTDGSGAASSDLVVSLPGQLEEEYEPEPVKEGLVHLNTADVQELETLPGIGPVTAQRIVEHRNTYGKFQSTEELKQVSGIGEKTFQQIQDLITVD